MYQLHSGPDSSHRILSELARGYGQSPVLDVGAAEGYLGRLLAGSGLVLDAVEPNPRYAAAARSHYREVFETTVERVELGESYGTIVCGDVLEHLVDPAGVLRKLVSALQPDGVVLVSLPNVAHLAVRLLLLSGRFPRMDRGPLDRTHLHFFTRSTAEQLLNQAGLQVIERRATAVPVVDIAGNGWRPMARIANPVQRLVVRLLPGLFAYQWIFVARRRPA